MRDYAAKDIIKFEKWFSDALKEIGSNEEELGNKLDDDPFNLFMESENIINHTIENQRDNTDYRDWIQTKMQAILDQARSKGGQSL